MVCNVISRKSYAHTMVQRLWICVGLTQARLNMPLAPLVTIRRAVQVEVKENGFQSGASVSFFKSY